jgi:hypothetical protein
MMTEHKVTNIGIAGITGRFGGLVLATLLENPDIKIRGLCRNASKLSSRHTQSPQLEVIEGDALDPSTLSEFVSDLDVVICAYLADNAFMIAGQKALIDACDQARVPRYIASDYTFDYTKLELGEHPAKDPMKIVHEYLQSKQHVQGVHVLVGGFIETFWSGYFQVWNQEEKSLVYWGSGEEGLEVSTYADAARWTVAVALDGGAIGIRRCKFMVMVIRNIVWSIVSLTRTVLGDKKNIREIAKAMKEAYGFEPRLQHEGSLDELYARMQSLFAKDPANVYAWLPL